MRFYDASQFVATEIAKGAYACGMINIGDLDMPKNVARHFDEMRDVCLDGLRMRWAIYCAEEHLGSPELIIRCGYASENLCRQSREKIFKSHSTGYSVDLMPNNSNFDLFVKFVDGYFGDFTRKYDKIITCSENGMSWVHIEYKGEGGSQRRKKLKYVASKMMLR